MKDSTKSVWVISIFIGASVLVCAGLVWYFWPYLQNYDSYTVKIEELIKGYTIRLGGWGWLFVIALNVIQIVIAILPGEPVELVSGVMYGWFWGLILAMTGCVIGESIVFWLVRKYGISFINRFVKTNVQEQKIFQDNNRVEAVTFLLFLIPGTPKDVLTYVAGLSKIRMRTFILISVVARIPSIVTSTIVGDSFITGNYILSIWIFGVTAVLGIIGLCLKDRAMAWAEKFRKHPETAEEASVLDSSCSEVIGDEDDQNDSNMGISDRDHYNGADHKSEADQHNGADLLDEAEMQITDHSTKK